MGTEDDHKALRDVPVPGVRAVERSHVGQHVELQEVVVDVHPFSIEHTVNDGREGENGQPETVATITLNPNVPSSGTVTRGSISNCS